VLIATLYDIAPGFVKVAQAARALRAMKALKSDYALFRSGRTTADSPTTA
jgi:hypothetical protein